MAIRERAKIRVEAIDAIGHFLEAVQEHQTDEVSKSEAIRRLVPHIQAAQSKGYNLKAIAGMLTDKGLPITPIVLKSYLGQAVGSESRKREKARARRATPKGRRSAGSPPGENPASASVGAGESSATGIPQGPGSARMKTPDKPVGPTARDLLGTPGPKPGEGAPKGTFIPRLDSDDL